MSDPGGVFRTERLLLRAWEEADREPFAAMNADPEVMRLFPAPLSRAESDELADRLDAFISEHGWGLWAVEVRTGVDAGRFAGFVGLARVPESMPFAPAIEIGWRLARWSWGRGYATEAGRASLEHAFGALGADVVVSFTSLPNEPSIAVMERLGMGRDRDGDFEHPLIEPDHPLRPHVLYRLRRNGRIRGR